MIVSEGIFIDTSPFIYLVENNPHYYSRVSDFLVEEYAENKLAFYTSTITLAEFLVKPKIANNLQAIKLFNETLEKLNIIVLDINRDIAELSAQLRSQYQFLKSLDAIQLASAINSNCSLLFTNDKVFKRIPEIKTILVDEI
jgi:predicted nucleic acid-binding protein